MQACYGRRAKANLTGALYEDDPKDHHVPPISGDKDKLLREATLSTTSPGETLLRELLFVDVAAKDCVAVEMVHPVRGGMQMFKLANAVTFTCSSWGKSITSKTVVVDIWREGARERGSEYRREGGSTGGRERVQEGGREYRREGGREYRR